MKEDSEKNVPPRSASQRSFATDAERAIDKGLRFMDWAVSEEGVWQCHYYAVAKPSELTTEENPFVGALGLLRLQTLRQPLAQAIVSRTRRQITSKMEFPGLWRYWPHLPIDLDTSSICSLAVAAHPWLLAGWNERAIASNCDHEGRFLTWIPGQERTSTDVDAVVNANVIACLGDGPNTASAQRWLVSLISEQREQEALRYYWRKMDLYAAMAQARALHELVFAGFLELLAARIQACRATDGSYGDSRRTSLALLSLFALDHAPSKRDLLQSLRFLLESQQDDGGWTASPFVSGPIWPAKRELVFVSRAYDTACCLAVLGKLS